MKSDRFWIVLVAGVLALSALAALLVRQLSPRGTVADVYMDGQLVLSVDLSPAAQRREIPIEGAAWGNVLEVDGGRVRMVRADCPDQVCVNTGWVDSSATPIVCLPGRIIVQIGGADGIDGVVK